MLKNLHKNYYIKSENILHGASLGHGDSSVFK